jgi:predicted acetyltransferase
MNRDYDYSVLSSPAAATRCSEIMAQSFVARAEDELSYLHQVGFDNVRLLRSGGEILGGLALLPMGQWFGGRRVAMTGVASVAIAPQVRGQGAATALMTALLQELAARGTALSALYPAVQALYQKVGYGLGGSRYTWRIATDQIQLGYAPLPCYPLPATQLSPHWPTLQQHLGQLQSGRLDRHDLIWQRLLMPPGDGTIFAYGIGAEPSPRGYLIGYQERGPNGTILTLRDWAATSLEAMQSLWALLYQQRGQIDWVQWAGGAVDPLALALPEQRLTGRDQSQWLLRIIDIQQALTQRGYPTAVGGDLHLQLRDPLLPGNNGRFILTVEGGRGHLAPGGTGDLGLDIRQLPPLFTGLRTAQELHALGLIQGSPEALDRATTFFSGPSPWMPDYF